jgi:hypothetical protein
MRRFACGGAGMNITVGDRVSEPHGGLRLMSAALDRIYRILQNFSWVDGALRLNGEFRIVNVE